MVSSNKILTVAYGTFSCTLEGFDNSFETMTAIAEYFRDLAQDDRYFGAEPPTPDAEMLARIAEREIERRVEARFEKGNLVLRPTDESETPRGDVAPDQSSGAALVGATAGVAATALAVADTQDDAFAPEDDLSDIDYSKLASEDDKSADDEAVSEPIDEIDLSEIVADEDAAADHNEILVSVVEDHVEDEDAREDDATLEHSEEGVFDEAEDEHDAMPVLGIVEAETVDAEVDAPAADSVADKLQRIRAVVAAKPQEDAGYIEDEHAMSGPDGDGIDENDAMDLVSEIPGFDDTEQEKFETKEEEASTPEAEMASVDDNLFTDTIAAVVADQIDPEDDEDDQILPDLDALQEDVTDAADDALSDTEAELAALRAKIAELEAQSESVASDDVEVEDDGAEDETTEIVSEEADDPIVARVGKAKRSDVEAALVAGDIEAYEDDNEAEDNEAMASSDPLPGADDSSLSDEQEAELARELAELQAEIDEDDDLDLDDEELATADEAPDFDEEEAEASIRKAVKLNNPARAMLTDTSIEEGDASVDRLIDQTETEMDEPEGNRRRSAIAHLRAAVAATKADRLLGLGKKVEEEEEPYREDLADAVRPRRPRVSQARSERPAAQRPAPLKLVAEQRVDVADDEDIKPVRPRRVTRVAEAVEADDTLGNADEAGFAEFAENAGAHTLPELLEAAASYMSFVEGRDQFSRPQLMTKLRQAEGDASSREERLRSFGQLLRDGKIEKKGGGRFAASDNIGFKPDERAAG